MTSTESPTSSARPIAGDHAIEAMAIAVEWAPPEIEKLTPGAFDGVYQSSEFIRSFLPERREMAGLQVQLGQGSTGALISPSQSKLVDYVRKKSDTEFEWAIGVRPDFISCTCTAYSRWRETKEKALALLTPFVEAAEGAGIGFQAIGLQYFDAFLWDVGDASGLQDTLSVDTTLLPRRVFSHENFWHVHQGWFSSAQGGKRILNNVNIDLQEMGKNKILRINGQHRIQAVSADGKTPQAITVSELPAIADELHIANKEILRNLLTKQMLKRVGMKAE